MKSQIVGPNVTSLKVAENIIDIYSVYIQYAIYIVGRGCPFFLWQGNFCSEKVRASVDHFFNSRLKKLCALEQKKLTI
jgi:hypothetical protein